VLPGATARTKGPCRSVDHRTTTGDQGLPWLPDLSSSQVDPAAGRPRWRWRRCHVLRWPCGLRTAVGPSEAPGGPEPSGDDPGKWWTCSMWWTRRGDGLVSASRCDASCGYRCAGRVGANVLGRFGVDKGLQERVQPLR